ncbi:restriction endonuclease subunit S [Vibrio fluvialis]|uniref:restriction endonuclease subunit S n=1 Tax=Vibrio fluvialis TaxID=676 RepID=UPI001C9CD94F|nr:restriction endonuclease subunit S [Vibrio fluvialis]EMA8957331.1 restriction endonuclease subunit S [Vibrio fluvialis]MBY7982692.1 restriction endonuclease subunit S [Vibrio fluvialis]MBY7999657.1 restriction endonuclease subunit S [Vibrio fluvialis]WMN56083.1 restriction endonuclease subunit S [Vibrio fluvialis]
MSWVEKSLGEVLKLEYGKPLDKSLRKEGGKYPAYGANGIKAWSDEYFHDEETIVVGRKGSAGELTLTDGKFWPLDVTYFVKTNKNDYDIKFLYYLLLSLDLPSLATGVKPGINRNNVYKIQAKFPSYSTQKQVAGQLDKAFADIEQARANTEQNLQNARELFDSYLQQVFSERGEGWKTVKVSDIAELISGQHIAAKDYNSDGKGIGYLTGPSDFGRMSPTVTKWTEHPKKTALSGDILITVKGSGVGKINTMVDPELAISRQLMAIRVDAEISQLLYWVLYLNYEYFQSLANGAAIPGISRIDVLNLEFSLPTKNQEAVISNIELVQQKVYELEKIYNQKLAALDELKQSLLQQAFTGQLTQG